MNINPLSPATADLTARAASAGREFEAMFLSEMFSHMFEGVGVDPIFGGGRGEEIFRSLLVNEYAKKIATGPGVGLSSHLQRSIIEMQAKANERTPA